MTDQEIQAAAEKLFKSYGGFKKTFTYAALAHDIFYAGGNQDDAAKICKALRELFSESQESNKHFKE